MKRLYVTVQQALSVSKRVIIRTLVISHYKVKSMPAYASALAFSVAKTNEFKQTMDGCNVKTKVSLALQR